MQVHKVVWQIHSSEWHHSGCPKYKWRTRCWAWITLYSDAQLQWLIELCYMVGCHAKSIHAQHLAFDLYLKQLLWCHSVKCNCHTYCMYLHTLPNTLLIYVTGFSKTLCMRSFFSKIMFDVHVWLISPTVELTHVQVLDRSCALL